MFLAFNAGPPSFDLFRRASVYPRQDLLQGRKEPLPPVLGALVGLLLIRPEARLLHAQVGPRARRGESPSDDTLETIGRPCVRQRFVRLDCHYPTVDSAQSARRLKRWSTTGLKSFFISHCSIRCGCVSARQIFSGGCSISRSTTTERVVSGFISGLVIDPSFSTKIRGGQTVRARRRHSGSS